MMDDLDVTRPYHRCAQPDVAADEVVNDSWRAVISSVIHTGCSDTLEWDSVNHIRCSQIGRPGKRVVGCGYLHGERVRARAALRPLVHPLHQFGGFGGLQRKIVGENSVV